jgi:hypothetical protein
MRPEAPQFAGPRPPHVPGVGDHLELLAPGQPCAIDVQLEGEEASDRELPAHRPLSRDAPTVAWRSRLLAGH